MMDFAGQPLSQLLHFQPLPICKTLVFGALKDLERWVFCGTIFAMSNGKNVNCWANGGTIMKGKKAFLPALLFTAFVIAACGEGGGPGTKNPPVVSTFSATDLGWNSCTLVGVVTPNSKDANVWFEWGTISDLSTYSTAPIPSLDSGSGAQTVTAPVSGLNQGTTYYFRIAASNNKGTSQGDILSLVTKSKPLVSTEASTGVGVSSATFNGNVNPGGLNTDAWFEWGIDSGLTTSNTTPLQAAGSGSISLTVTYDQTGLNPATTYYYRISAANAAGVANGNILSFATSTPLPSMTTGSVTYAGMYVAVVEGLVNPNGYDSDAWFESGTDPNLSTFVTSTPIAVGAGTEYVSINQTLTNLSSDSTYYYRSAASNSEDTGVGDILNFSTLSSVVGTYWSKTFGGADHDSVGTIIPTADKGFFVVGFSYSTTHICWAIKLAESGDIQWQKAYSAGSPYSAQQTADGGFIIAGQKGIGQSSVLDVLKLDSSGNVSWYKLYGGGFEGARSVQQTSDGGYIVAGFTWTYAGSYNDMWVLKLSSDGTVEWEKSYNLDSTYNVAYSIQQTSDSGYIVAGHLQYTFGNAQVWVLKLTADGSVDWQKIYGTFNSEYAKKILQTGDGGYVVLVYNAQAINDRIWVLKLDSSGNIEWQKGYGGAGVGSIALTADAGFILAGSKKQDGTINYDAMAAKLASNGDIEWQKTYGGPASDGATSVEQIHDGGFVLAGYTQSFGAGGRDFWILRLKDDGSAPPFGDDASVTPTILHMFATNSDSVGVSSQATGQSSSVASTNTNATVQNQAP